jgi:hypothetical protein
MQKAGRKSQVSGEGYVYLGKDRKQAILQSVMSGFFRRSFSLGWFWCTL